MSVYVWSLVLVILVLIIIISIISVITIIFIIWISSGGWSSFARLIGFFLLESFLFLFESSSPLSPPYHDPPNLSFENKNTYLSPVPLACPLLPVFGVLDNVLFVTGVLTECDSRSLKLGAINQRFFSGGVICENFLCLGVSAVLDASGFTSAFICS